MSVPCMQRNLAKEVSLCAYIFILSNVLLDSWNKSCINTNRRTHLIVEIKLNSHLVILVLQLFIFTPKNRILRQTDLSHDQHGHWYKYTCAKFSQPHSRLKARKGSCAGKGGGSLSCIFMQVSKRFLWKVFLLFFLKVPPPS